MRIAFGPKGLSLIECINPQIRKYRIRWDMQPNFDGDGNEQGVSFMESEVLHKPTLEEVKKIVLNGYNEQVDKQILSGFVWKGIPIWLSSENQFNYKAAYDLAIQTEGANLPIKFKFGTTENPEYFIFESIEDLSDFYLSAMTFINKTLQEGWQKKDSIDWDEYKKYL